jgi:putative (di)nucleoside polyphosphate hydrolase
MTPEDIATLPYRRCVGVVLANPAGQVFAGQRIDNPGPAWQMPQGGIDPGEAPRAAALRELWEETGVTAEKVSVEDQTEDWLPYDLPQDLVPKLWKGRYRGQEQLWFLMRFHGTDADVNIRTDHPEFSRWQWMAPDLLIERIVPFKQDIYRTVFTAFADRLR